VVDNAALKKLRSRTINNLFSYSYEKYSPVKKLLQAHTLADLDPDVDFGRSVSH
jgi:hypothetical protein